MSSHAACIAGRHSKALFECAAEMAGGVEAPVKGDRRDLQMPADRVNECPPARLQSAFQDVADHRGIALRKQRMKVTQ